jgi:2-polyprenyl-3-methyl-5-hydroxy-6-metoxy-1,4-benzoquinol methylase
VLDRLDLDGRASAFDVIVATNVLTYYDPFEQTLALLNVTRMLKPGGVFLSNDPIAVLPVVPLNEVGVTEVQYSKLPNSRDEVVWYQRQ